MINRHSIKKGRKYYSAKNPKLQRRVLDMGLHQLPSESASRTYTDKEPGILYIDQDGVVSRNRRASFARWAGGEVDESEINDTIHSLLSEVRAVV